MCVQPRGKIISRAKGERSIDADWTSPLGAKSGEHKDNTTNLKRKRLVYPIQQEKERRSQRLDMDQEPRDRTRLYLNHLISHAKA